MNPLHPIRSSDNRAVLRFNRHGQAQTGAGIICNPRIYLFGEMTADRATIAEIPPIIDLPPRLFANVPAGRR